MAQLTEPSAAPAASARRVAAPVQAGRGQVFGHAVAFVLGFGLVFTLAGAALGLMGRNLNPYMPGIARVGAVLLVIFALTTLGVMRRLSTWIRTRTDLAQNPAAAALVSILDFFNSLLYTERRVTEMHQVNRNWGYLSSSLLGVSFSAGWVPCIGPILASIFFLAGNSATVGQGAALLAIYSLGLGIPFLLTGAAFGRMTNVLRRLNRHANVVSVISGIFLFYVAFLLWTDSLGALTNRFNGLNQWVLGLESSFIGALGIQESVIGLSLVAGAPLALFAGLISFLSPCVLPLVPAYIGYLSSTAVGQNKA
jgi:cytochrome c-type biogenesis protein